MEIPRNVHDARSLGEVFTRRWVADWVLDLAGYSSAEDLGDCVIVEPACGTGAFLVPIVERLAESCQRHGRSLEDTGSSIRACDLVQQNVEAARRAVAATLADFGVAHADAADLGAKWISRADFLLDDTGVAGSGRCADFVVGNPPYVRLEDLPSDLNAAYRRRWPSMRGRADVYVGFFEAGLAMLQPEGRLAFICADRWMHNRYGARLRSRVASHFSVDALVRLHDVDAFEESVSAYPAITVIRNGRQGPAKIVQARSGFDQRDARDVSRWLDAETPTPPPDARFDAARLHRWFASGDHWPTGSAEQLALLARLEERFDPLEHWSTGTRVGIGVATGCDELFIVEDDQGIEHSRLLPVVTAADVATGTPRWSGRFLVNPWEDGRLVDLAEFPDLARYLEQHSARIKARHVARKRPATWYRTIDRVDPTLSARPKLLLPDLKATAHPVLDAGSFYPHHNLYYVVSDKWDLEVLGGLLLSDVANLFVGAYCVKMRGGTYRFQAQYLRKIRVPSPDAIPAAAAAALSDAFRRRDRNAATQSAAELYRISAEDLSAVRGSAR